EKVIHQPDMGGTKASSRREGFARGEPVVDLEPSAEGHDMPRAVRAVERQRFTSGNVRHADAVTALEFRRCCRPAVPRQIGGRCDEDASALADRPQLHGAIGKRTKAQRYVHPFADEIDALVRQAEIDRDVWMAVLKSKDQPADVPDTECCRAGDMN